MAFEAAIILGIFGLGFFFLKVSEQFNSNKDWFAIAMRWSFLVAALLVVLITPTTIVDLVDANNGTNWATVNQTLTPTPYTQINDQFVSVISAQINFYTIALVFFFAWTLWLITMYVISLFQRKKEDRD